LLGAGIKLTRLDKDLREADVEMHWKRWNKNYVGVHFGGSLFSMTWGGRRGGAGGLLRDKTAHPERTKLRGSTG
jgi:hypothetical protein